ncbi:hypothetical protein [Streptomyces fumanus]|uniref:Uncharacterized protein n=1 Tax=Streptomyces fumanus TaxID=67302 RepID=A0A919AG73_9ACTN|nr:hypothetical protein [Streptomyces fumanus]GHF06193.1 hypothetical protein GCM10018772_33890 [Streptomyces fumanus]
MSKPGVAVPAVPVPLLLPPLPTPAESTSLAGRRIVVIGQGGSARAVAAKLGAHGATVALHPPGRPIQGGARERPDGVLVLLPRTAGNAAASDAVATAVRLSPHWLLVLAPGTDPAEAGRAALALDG